MMGSSRRWTLLLASHAGAAVLGVLLGTMRGEERLTVVKNYFAEIEGNWQLTAARLACRFGSPEQSRGLLQNIVQEVPRVGYAWGIIMQAELHLAFLDGEDRQPSGPTPHLAAATLACTQLAKKECSPQLLRERASALARTLRE